MLMAPAWKRPGARNLRFPSLASYAGGVNYLSTLEASGSGSTLLFPKLATLTSDTTKYSSGVQIEALAGGAISLPLLTQIISGPVQLESDGSGSQLIAPALTTFQGHTGQRYISSLQETGGGIIDDPDLASINSVNLDWRCERHVHDFCESRAVDRRRDKHRFGRNSAGSGKPGCPEHGHAEHPGRVDGQQPGHSDDSGGKHCRRSAATSWAIPRTRHAYSWQGTVDSTVAREPQVLRSSSRQCQPTWEASRPGS